MRRRRAAVVLALVMALCPAAMARNTAVPQAAVHRVIGIDPNGLPPTSDPAARQQAFARIRSTGSTVARIDAGWAQIETKPGVYDFSALDARVRELLANGLQPLIILDYGNPLYSATGSALQAAGFTGLPPFGIGAPDLYPPDSPAPFARFAAALAAHYKNQVHLLEVWNEENLGWRFWEPHEDPAAYAALLKATYKAVKAVAPRDQIALGGTFYPAVDAQEAAADGIPLPTGEPADELALPHQGTLDFLEHAFAAAPDLGHYFDAVAYHPYHFPYMAPEVDIPGEGTTASSMVALRRLLDAHGLKAKPIWITEVGWPNNTGAYGPTPQKSASYLVRTFATAWANGIETVLWYCYGDTGSDWEYDQESAFGIVDYAGQPKPVLYAWQTLDRELAALPFSGSVAGQLKLPADGHALRFASRQRSVTVVWLAPETMFSDQGPGAPAEQTASVATPAGTTEILDMTGHRLPLGRSFDASPYPVYLITVRRAGSGNPRHKRHPKPRPKRSHPRRRDRT